MRHLPAFGGEELIRSSGRLPWLGVVRVALGATVLLCGCTSSADDPLSTVRGDSCLQRFPPIETLPADSISPEQACVLAEVALKAFAYADPSISGVEPSDTAVIESILIVPMREVDMGGRTIQSYWAVGFSLNGRPYDVEVDIDRATAHAQVRLVHKPL